MAQANTARVYVSYSLFETELAIRLATDLKNAGVSVFLDRLDANQNTPETVIKSIKQGIRGSQVLLSIVSPAYVKLRYTRAELDYGDKKGKTILAAIAAPIASADWPEQLPRRNAIDFSDWRDAQVYARQFERLISGIGVPQVNARAPKERYLNALIARMEMRFARDEQLSVDTLDQQDSEMLKADYRPYSKLRAAWGREGQVTLLERTSSNHTAQSERLPRQPDTWRRTSNLTFVQALERHPKLALLGGIGMGKSTLLQRLALDIGRAHRDQPATRPLPFHVALALWEDDAQSAEAFLQTEWVQQWTDAGVTHLEDIPDLLAGLHAGNILLLADGLNELGAVAPLRAAALKLYLHGQNAPSRAIVTCREGKYDDPLDLALPAAVLEPWDDGAVTRGLRAWLGERADGLLAQLFPREGDDVERAYYLMNLARTPAMLTALAFLYKIAPNSELPRSVGGLYKRYLANLSVWRRITQLPLWMPFKEMEAAFAALAVPMIEGERPAYISAFEAQKWLGDERFLKAGRNAGLIEVEHDKLRFAHALLQAYFAAVGTHPADLSLRLMSAQFGARGERQAGKWDQVVVMLAGMVPNPETVVREVAEIDPYLAGQCLASGVRLLPAVYDSVIHSLSTYANTQTVAGRFAAAQTLRGISGQDAGGRDMSALLIEIARGGEWRTRAAAASALADVDVKLPASLIKALRDWDWTPNTSAESALRDTGSAALPLLLGVLRDDSDTRRRGAAWALGIIGDTASVPVLIERLQDDEPLVRREAVVALQGARDNAAIPALLGSLHDLDWRVRRAAGETLATFHDAMPLIMQALNDADLSVRLMCIEILSRIGDESIAPLLIELSRNETVEVRAAAVEALSRIEGETVLPRLAELLGDEARAPHAEYTIGEMVANALKTMNTPEAQAALIMFWRRSAETTETSEETSAASAQETDAATVDVVADLADVADGQAIFNQLHAEMWEMRKAAVLALRDVPAEHALPALVSALQDDDVQVRWAVVETLRHFEGDSVVEGLLTALHDSDPLVYDAAGEALTTIGSPAVPGLLDALQDNSEDVRGIAVDVLGRLSDVRLIAPLQALLEDTAIPRVESRSIGEMAQDAIVQITERLGLAPEPLDAEPMLSNGDVPAEPMLEFVLDEMEAAAEAPAPEIVYQPQGSLPTPALAVVETAQSLQDTEPLMIYAPMPERIGEPVKPTPAADIVEEPTPAEDQFIPSDEKIIPEALEAWPQLDELLLALHDSDYNTRESAMRRMRDQARERRALDDAHVIGRLANALRDENYMVRWSVVEAMAWLKDDASVPMLLEALHDKHFTVRLAVIRAMQEVASVHVSPGLLEALRDPHPLVREKAAETLGIVGSANIASPGLIDALRDEEPFVRRAAAESLGALRGETGVAALTFALTDPEPMIRWTAAQALGKIGHGDAVPSLINRLSDRADIVWEDERRVCDVAADALERIGTDSAVEAVARWRATGMV